MTPIRTSLATLVACTLPLVLSACGGSSTQPPRKVISAPPPPRQTQPVRQVLPPPVRQAVPFKPAPRPAPPAAAGLESVIGATSADLTRQFGAPRLDAWEGDARKLQFAGPACVLDIYLYPPAQGREPQASHVEARRASDGREVDKVDCVSALRKH